MHWVIMTLLNGRVLSDRFTYSIFCQGIHSSFERLCQDLLRAEQAFNPQGPLPSDFSPAHLLRLCISICRTHTRDNSTRMVHTTPSGLLVRALHHGTFDDADDEITEDIHAIGNTGCDLCGGPHFNRECPRLPILRSNPDAQRRLAVLFNSTPARRTMPPTAGRSAAGRPPASTAGRQQQLVPRPPTTNRRPPTARRPDSSSIRQQELEIGEGEPDDDFDDTPADDSPDPSAPDFQ